MCDFTFNTLKANIIQLGASMLREHYPWKDHHTPLSLLRLIGSMQCLDYRFHRRSGNSDDGRDSDWEFLGL
jgi:hypothetical protein